MPSKSFKFNMILSYAMMQFSEVCSYSCANQELPHGINKVLLQKTFQPSISLPNAFSGLEANSGRDMVPKAGLEPAWITPHAPQTCVSTSSTTSAF